jgi:hypothetical protein
MQVDGNLFGNPYRNVWAAVILTALDDLKIRYEQNPKWSSGIERQRNRRQAIWFFNYPSQSSLSWICEKLNLDLQSTVKKAHEICPEVKINLSIEKAECYHKGEAEKAVYG